MSDPASPAPSRESMAYDVVIVGGGPAGRRDPALIGPRRAASVRLARAADGCAGREALELAIDRQGLAQVVVGAKAGNVADRGADDGGGGVHLGRRVQG